MEEIWIEEPIGEEFTYEFGQDTEDKELLHKAKAIAKQISRRRSMAIIVKWLYSHGKEPHRPLEIAEAVNLADGTVCWNLKRLANIHVVKETRIEGLDKHPLYTVNRRIGKMATQRFLWLISFKLIKILPKRQDRTSFDYLRGSSEFIKILEKYNLSFQEGLEGLELNSWVGLSDNYVKLKENLPLKYYPRKEEEKQAGKPEPEEEVFE